jgi:hypothetical protein
MYGVRLLLPVSHSVSQYCTAKPLLVTFRHCSRLILLRDVYTEKLLGCGLRDYGSVRQWRSTSLSAGGLMGSDVDEAMEDEGVSESVKRGAEQLSTDELRAAHERHAQEDEGDMIQLVRW